MNQTLLQRIAAGDLAAVQECIDRYGGLVWSLARRFLAGQADAEDAVQDVFIELWKSAARYDPDVAAEATFVAMIARRRLIDRRRRISRQIESGPTVPVEEIDVPGQADQVQAVETSDEAALAAEALGSLRPEQQRILRLSVYDGWSHQKIADHLQMPLGTVKTHVRRGLIRVRELLAQRQAEQREAAP